MEKSSKGGRIMTRIKLLAHIVIPKKFWKNLFNHQHIPCSFGLSTTSQQYFSLRTNQPPTTSQQYFSLGTKQHQPSATRQRNKLK
jgi:hypothetical protein